MLDKEATLRAKPCPFCGVKPRISTMRTGGWHISIDHGQSCAIGHLAGMTIDDPDKFLKIWNQRKGPDNGEI